MILYSKSGSGSEKSDISSSARTEELLMFLGGDGNLGLGYDGLSLA